MENFNNAIEIIGQSLYEAHGENIPEEVNNLMDAIDEGYVLVEWPESQEFMEEDWFDEEAILALGSEDKTGSSAYFIPIKRIV